MKYSPRFSYTFTPSSNTLNLSANTGFNIAGLLAVIDVTQNVMIYASSSSGLGYSAISGGNILTLQYNCSSLASTDILNFIYDDGIQAPTVRSTTSVAADVAAVVMSHPAGITYIQGVQSTPITGSITSASSVIGPINAASFNVATIGIYGTYTGVSCVFEASTDNTNWFTLQGSRVDNGTIGTGISLGSTGNYAWDLSVGAWNYIRVRATAWTSGTASVFIGLETMPYDPAPATIPQGLTAVGGAVPIINPLLIAGSDGTYVRLLNTVAKGTQGAYALSTQDLKDSGRNVTNYFMNVPVVTTATDTLMSLTGYKSNAAVTATTTPAVTTSGKTYRITGITITYVATATAGFVKFTLRANTTGVAALASNAVQSWTVGGPAAVAGVTETVQIDNIDGLEFLAGTGIGISMYGLGATIASAAVGYGMISITGFEY